MKKIILFGDSLCDMATPLAEKYGVNIIPLGVTFKDDETTYLDGININKDIIFEKFNEITCVFKTALCCRFGDRI